MFDATAGPERREAEARFVRGHLLRPGDAARTDWRLRCAPPPYDGLPVPRASIPSGVILSREANSWVHEDAVQDIALPLYQGIMVQPFVPSARGWISGTGLRGLVILLYKLLSRTGAGGSEKGSRRAVPVR